ncbi:MAG: protein kinase [Oligosphaeraceae bacterium]|nr:protein kinase [Oligosphaeraceae bacterium]
MNKNANNKRGGGSTIPATGKRKYLNPDGSAVPDSDAPAAATGAAVVNTQPKTTSPARRYLDSSEIDPQGNSKRKVAETQQIFTKRLRRDASSPDSTAAAGSQGDAEEGKIQVISRNASNRLTTAEPEAVEPEAAELAASEAAASEADCTVTPERPDSSNRRFLENLRNSLPEEAAVLDSDGILEIRSACKRGGYELLGLFAKGAESLLYRARTGRQIFCVKAIRNQWDVWLGNSKTKRDEEKLQDVSYSTKLRHLRNEHDVARALYSDQEEMPIARIFGLRRVTKFGLELGYDLLMEYLWGHDLSQRTLLKMLLPEDKVRIMYEATKAVNYMHKRKFIHLDIKPSNFVLTHTGQVRLIDFGISVSCGHRSRSITGTAGYLSPEQIAKETLDEKTDIFALGITFAILFGGRPLLQTHDELLSRSTRRDAKFHLESSTVSAVSETPELINMPQIAEIIRNCSILKRNERIPSCNYLLNLLQNAAEKYNIKLE